MSIDNLIEYIKERCGRIGCNMDKFDCDKYFDCDVCLVDKLNEYKDEIYQQGRVGAIDEFESLLYAFGYYEPFSMKLEIYHEDLKRLIIQLKEQK